MPRPPQVDPYEQDARVTQGRSTAEGSARQAKTTSHGQSQHRRRYKAQSTHLKRKGNAIAPLVITNETGTKDTGSEELPDDEAHVGPAGKVDTKNHGQHLAGIGGGRGSEDAPGETTEDLADQKHLTPSSEEDNEDKA